jgi:hypothetical protein
MPPSTHDDDDEMELGVAEGLDEPRASAALIPHPPNATSPGDPGLIS